MNRRLAVLVLAAVPIAVLVSGCAVGFPRETSYPLGGAEHSAELNAYIGSSSVGDTTYFWRYGKDRNYTNTTPQRTIWIYGHGGYQFVSEELDGLTADTTYHFQLCARDMEESPARTNCSEDHTFATQPVGSTWKTFCTNFLGGTFSTFNYGDPPGATGWSCSFADGVRGPNPDPGNLLLLSCPTSDQTTEATRIRCFANQPA